MHLGAFHNTKIKYNSFDFFIARSLLHEVCQPCTLLVHSIVLQEQWIWAIHDVLFHSSAVWETYPACERTVYRACTTALIAFVHCMPHRWFARVQFKIAFSSRNYHRASCA